jgi:hypothetical protein
MIVLYDNSTGVLFCQAVMSKRMDFQIHSPIHFMHKGQAVLGFTSKQGGTIHQLLAVRYKYLSGPFPPPGSTGVPACADRLEAYLIWFDLSAVSF